MLVAVAEGRAYRVRCPSLARLRHRRGRPRSPLRLRRALLARRAGAELGRVLRRLASELESSPSGFTLPLEDTARALGLGCGAAELAVPAHDQRCAQFHLLHFDERTATLLARRKLPPLTRGQVTKLPEALQRQHQDWQANPALADAAPTHARPSSRPQPLRARRGRGSSRRPAVALAVPTRRRGRRRRAWAWRRHAARARCGPGLRPRRRRLIPTHPHPCDARASHHRHGGRTPGVAGASSAREVDTGNGGLQRVCGLVGQIGRGVDGQVRLPEVANPGAVEEVGVRARRRVGARERSAGPTTVVPLFPTPPRRPCTAPGSRVLIQVVGRRRRVPRCRCSTCGS